MADPVSIHEAAHASVALHLGLSVREVRVRGALAVPRYCETLYGIPAGTLVPGTGCILEEDCLDVRPEETLVSMIAPSCIKTGDDSMDAYALLETTLALAYGEKHHGYDPDWLLDRAHQAVLMCEQQILDLADRLDAEGVVDGSDLTHNRSEVLSAHGTPQEEAAEVHRLGNASPRDTHVG